MMPPVIRTAHISYSQPAQVRIVVIVVRLNSQDKSELLYRQDGPTGPGQIEIYTIVYIAIS